MTAIAQRDAFVEMKFVNVALRAGHLLVLLGDEAHRVLPVTMKSADMRGLRGRKCDYAILQGAVPKSIEVGNRLLAREYVSAPVLPQICVIVGLRVSNPSQQAFLCRARFKHGSNQGLSQTVMRFHRLGVAPRLKKMMVRRNSVHMRAGFVSTV